MNNKYIKIMVVLLYLSSLEFGCSFNAVLRLISPETILQQTGSLLSIKELLWQSGIKRFSLQDYVRETYILLFLR